MIFSRAQAIIIIQIMQQTAEYYAGTGAKCLLCGQERAKTTTTRPPDLEGFVQIRHHTCRCGHTFKSVEKLEKESIPAEIPHKTPKTRRKR